MRKALPAAGLASVVAMLTVAVIALGHNKASADMASPTPWSSYYSVLKSPAARAADTQAALPKGVPTDWGIDPATLHEVPTSQDAPARVWVGMSDRGPCILASPNRLPYLAHPDEPGGGTCGGTALDNAPSLAFGGVAKGTGTFAEGETIGIGLVPDGVAHVVLHKVDGSTETLAVHDNIYTFDSASPTRSVSFSAASTGAVYQEVQGVNQ